MVFVVGDCGISVFVRFGVRVCYLRVLKLGSKFGFLFINVV